MNLDEAIEAGFADIDGRLLTLPDIDANGRAIVPYGVRTLGRGCINFYSKLWNTCFSLIASKSWKRKLSIALCT